MIQLRSIPGKVCRGLGASSSWKHATRPVARHWRCGAAAEEANSDSMLESVSLTCFWLLLKE